MLFQLIESNLHLFLKFMNHSKDFWQQVNLLFPKYKEAEKYLKENGFKLYQLD